MKPYLVVFSLTFHFLFMPSASASSALPLSLQQLATSASLIFYGTVISNQVVKDDESGQIATLTKFEIIDLIKGTTGRTHTIKQIGGYLKETNIMLKIQGVPQYTTGNQYIVFLPEKSSIGFSSPVGLSQGSFSVTTINGEKIVSNGRNLSARSDQTGRNVQVPLAVQSENPSQSHLDDFISTVRAYNMP